MTATEGPADRPQDTCRVSCVRFVFPARWSYFGRCAGGISGCLTTQTWSSATAPRSRVQEIRIPLTALTAKSR